ncbi:DUF3560 domain-containing protein [Bacteroides sp.]|uniref:DUF3560 domain-containing protein n=1 Tax=Bacteroides sp. TaxID=29523 RepID=UPI00263443E6|nr:DUF3560 domain-containing protein [Bacteroides sp.]MDD3038854.1 DUF3560 domain-containing protein [Bacteroides sp.]
MNRKEKQEARVDRLRELAKRSYEASDAACRQSSKMASIIPMGQPVHGLADRKYRDKIGAKMDKSIELSRKAEYFERKAEAAENNTSIYLGDDDAVDRLQEKVESLEKAQGMMKAANKIVRSKKLNDIAKIEQLQSLGFSEEKSVKLTEPDCYGEYGFASYTLTNNSARIRDAKQRLERAKMLKETATKEYVIKSVRIVENSEENRLQLFFDGVPDEEIRSQLKHNAFRWSRFNGCWQSYLNRWQIDRAKMILNSISE